MNPQAIIRLGITISNRHSRAYLFKKLNPADPGHHIAIVTTYQPDVETVLDMNGIKPATKQASAMVGQLLAAKVKALGLNTVKLTRKDTLPYHGKVKAMIDALRENGVAVH